VKPLHHVFALPALIGAITVFGLLSALVADGVWDVLSWLALGSAVVVAAWFAVPRAGSAASALRANDPSSSNPTS
jgi:hypothetical protein